VRGELSSAELETQLGQLFAPAEAPETPEPGRVQLREQLKQPAQRASRVWGALRVALGAGAAALLAAAVLSPARRDRRPKAGPVPVGLVRQRVSWSYTSVWLEVR
jgi:hypothetical protein